MILQTSDRVDVISVYNDKSFLPVRLRWKGRIYKILKLGYHHRVKTGNTLHHIFHVATSSLAFRLNFDTDILSWTLEEVSDGFAD